MSKPLHLLGLAALLAAMVFANLKYATEGNRADIWAWTPSGVGTREAAHP